MTTKIASLVLDSELMSYKLSAGSSCHDTRANPSVVQNTFAVHGVDESGNHYGARKFDRSRPQTAIDHKLIYYGFSSIYRLSHKGKSHF